MKILSVRDMLTSQVRGASARQLFRELKGPLLDCAVKVSLSRLRAAHFARIYRARAEGIKMRGLRFYRWVDEAAEDLAAFEGDVSSVSFDMNGSVAVVFLAESNATLVAVAAFVAPATRANDGPCESEEDEP